MKRMVHTDTPPKDASALRAWGLQGECPRSRGSNGSGPLLSWGFGRLAEVKHAKYYKPQFRSGQLCKCWSAPTPAVLLHDEGSQT